MFLLINYFEWIKWFLFPSKEYRSFLKLAQQGRYHVEQNDKLNICSLMKITNYQCDSLESFLLKPCHHIYCKIAGPILLNLIIGILFQINLVNGEQNVQLQSNSSLKKAHGCQSRLGESIARYMPVADFVQQISHLANLKHIQFVRLMIFSKRRFHLLLIE